MWFTHLPKIPSLWLLDDSIVESLKTLASATWGQILAPEPSLWPWPNQMTLLNLSILGRLDHWLQLSPAPPCTHTTAMASLWMERDRETCFSQRNMSGGQCVSSELSLTRPCLFCSLSYILNPQEKSSSWQVASFSWIQRATQEGRVPTQWP